MLVMSVLPLFSCSGRLADEQQLMQKANNYLDQRNINAAVIELKNVLQANPENARARYLLAGINLNYGDFDTASKEFRRAAAAGWNREESRIGIARTLLGQGRFSELRDAAQPDDDWSVTGRASLLALQAVAEAGLGNTDRAGELAAQAEQLDPAALQVFKAKAQLLVLAGQLDEAGKVMAAALDRYPGNQELLLLDANIHQRAGDTAAAGERYRRVMDGDPPGYISSYGRNARLQLTQLQILAGEYPAAETTLKPLYRRNPKDPISNYLGGVLAFQQGDYVRAEQLLLKVLKLAPEHNPTRLLYGTVNFAEGNYEQAAYFLAKYLVSVPDNLAARKLLARSYILLKRPEEAHNVLQTALVDDTNDAELLALVGVSELAGGRRDTGIAELQKALMIDSGSLAIRTELARAYLDAGDTGLAIRELRSILASGGEQQQTGMLLVLAHLRAGDFAQAIKQVLEMLHGHEGDPALLTLAGNVFAASGDHSEARRYLQHALQLKPDLPPAVLTLANIEELEKNYPAAVKLYRQLVDMDLASPLPMLALARVAEQQGDTGAMLGWLQRAVKYAPDDNQPRLLLAEYYLRKGDLELARQLVGTAVEKAPQDTAALVMQGRLLMAGRRYDDAIKPLQQLLAISPDSAVGHILLAESFLELGRLPESLEQLKAVLDKDPASMPAMALMVRLDIRRGSTAQALEFSKRIKAAYPELYLGYEMAGDTLMAQGDYADAGNEYAQAFDRLRRVDLVIKLADSANRLGNHDAAAGYLKDWLAKHPDDVQAMQYYGSTLQSAGKTELAIRQYERVLELDRKNPVALNNLAGLYQLAGRPEALELAKRALHAAPEDPGVMDTLAWIQVQQGSVQEGLNLLERAVKRLPDNPAVRYHHAVAVYQSGDRGRARQLLQALVKEGKPFEGRDDAVRMLEGG